MTTIEKILIKLQELEALAEKLSPDAQKGPKRYLWLLRNSVTSLQKKGVR